MITFLAGFIVGASVIIVILYIFIVEPWTPPIDNTQPPIEQFRATRIPEELRKFLKSGEDGQGVSRWESCNSISLLLHMLFQEHKDTRVLRRWVHKRLQMEMNDITTRSAAGRLIQEIRIRELSLGTKFMTINSIRVENVEMAEDNNTFEKIVFILDIDYSGGFETSIDVATIIAKRASLSVKITKLAGMVRVILSRQPYHHWTFSFVSQPLFETDISSQIQGHQLKRLIPIIKEAFRRSLQRKHVWPNYKIRYRPFFPNPIFQASPSINSFTHIKLEGGMEVTVLQCSRLKNSLLDEKNKNYEVYCRVSIDNRPNIQNEDLGHSVSVLLTFSRYDLTAPIGLTFDRTLPTAQSRSVRVLSVEDQSLADKACFKPGDVLVAINNVPIRCERQATRFLQQTTGDLMVLVDRSLDDIEDDEKEIKDDMEEDEQIVVDDVRDIDDFVVGESKTIKKKDDDAISLKTSISSKNVENSSVNGGRVSIVNDKRLRRRHSVSNLDSSFIDTNTESINSSVFSLNALQPEKPTAATVQRAESARAPQILVSHPSFDLRRTQSESRLDKRVIDAVMSSSNDLGADNIVEQEIKRVIVGKVERSRNSDSQLEIDSLDFGVDKDKTLTQADAVKGALSVLSKNGGSIASLTSINSNRTDTGTEGETNDDEHSEFSRKRASSARRTKIQATFAAGKRKVLDLVVQKRKPSEAMSIDGDCIEVGADAGCLFDEDKTDCSSKSMHASQHSSSGKKSPVDDKREKKKRKQISESPSPRNGIENKTNSSKTRITKSVHFQKDVMWGQSLHFDLDSMSKVPYKYLNITVLAKETPATSLPSSFHATSSNSTTTTTDTPSDLLTPKNSTVKTGSMSQPKDVVLGSLSLYVPQIIDDCRLTLSNCHRESFQLKQPTHSEIVGKEEPILTEFSRHAGFDPRLCFGDITLGFRYFPDGLPSGTNLNIGDENAEECVNVSASSQEATPGSAGRPFSPPIMSPSNHDWKLWYGKNSATCSMCRGKIWLRNASCCSRCQVICHNKCVIKANQGGIACSPTQNETSHSNESHEDMVSPPPPDILSTPGSAGSEESQPLVSAASTSSTALSETPELGKKARFRRVTEKFSSWRKTGKRKDENDQKREIGEGERLSQQSIGTSSLTSEGSTTTTDRDSPMASIQEVLADVLPNLDGSPFINGLYFQPGNAYNEQTIRNAKLLGREIYSELANDERVDKINTQIDRIQSAIRETKDSRLSVMQNGGEMTEKFQGLDERLQALAVLMLHYCSALQDCQSGRTTPAPLSGNEMEESPEALNSLKNADEEEDLSTSRPTALNFDDNQVIY